MEYIERDRALKTICKFCENKNCIPNLPCSLYIAFQCMDADKIENEKVEVGFATDILRRN